MAIYALHTTPSASSAAGFRATLELCTEHRLAHAAYSLCHGHFGQQVASINACADDDDTAAGGERLQFICVQLLNGSLTFFEHNGIRFECRLPATGAASPDTDPAELLQLLPGPMCYVPRTDAFVRCTGGGQLECFRYQDTAECGGGGDSLDFGMTAPKEPTTMSNSRPLEPMWTCCVGEWALDMRVVRIAK